MFYLKGQPFRALRQNWLLTDNFLIKKNIEVINKKIIMFINWLKKQFLYRYCREYVLKLIVSVNPEWEVDRCYYPRFKKHCDLKNPKNLIEKIYWLELHSDTSLWTLCADKYRVREYIGRLGLIDYMPRLYGHWDKVKDIDFNSLPSSFVIKSNNGCGTNKIVRDKSQLDIKKLIKELKQWIVLPNGYDNAQIHNTKIKRCIIAEELLSNDFASLSPNSLVDFKVWCINGNPLYIWVAYNRVLLNVNMQLYDTDWNMHPEYMRNSATDIYNENDPLLPKPKCLDEMLEVAKKIAEPFKQIRVDFYIVNNKPVIGELTMSSGYGYFTDEFYLMLGDMIKLP